MILNVNTDASIKFTVKLERLHRSALPSAVRGSLNKCAYNLKTETMPRKASHVFEKRDPNFFKANSRFENAKGFDINSMKSTVGFVENNLRDRPNFAVHELEQQEEGGVIPHKSFIPLDEARVGNSSHKKVRPNARLKQLKKLANGALTRGKNWAERAIKSAVYAGKGNMLLMPGHRGGVVWKITSITRKGKDTVFTKQKLYSFRKNRSVSVHRTNFMHDASMETHKKIEQFYIEEATRQLNKFK